LRLWGELEMAAAGERSGRHDLRCYPRADADRATRNGQADGIRSTAVASKFGGAMIVVGEVFGAVADGLRSGVRGLSRHDGGLLIFLLDGAEPEPHGHDLLVIFPRSHGQSDYAAKRFICVFNSNSIGLT
jgi:hypothetical protein